MPPLSSNISYAKNATTRGHLDLQSNALPTELSWRPLSPCPISRYVQPIEIVSQMVYNENAEAKLNDHLLTRLEVDILLLDQKSTIISLCTVLHSITAVFPEQVQKASRPHLISDGKNGSGSTEI